MPIIDLEATASIKEFVEDADGLASGKATGEVDPAAYFARFALNTSLTLNYGIRISGNISAPLLKEIVHVEREVSNLRSTSNNWQDYVPLMRLWPGGRNTEAGQYRKRRDVYMDKLLGMLKQRIAEGTDKPCITGNILKDSEARLNDGTSSSRKLFPEAHFEPRSRDQVDLSVDGICRHRHHPRESHHEHGLPLIAARPRDPSSRARGDCQSLSQRRRMGEMLS